MSNQLKKLFSLFIILAVMPLMGTSDSPSSSSSSSLTANMSDATESKRTKRKMICAITEDADDSEELSEIRQKTVRINPNPSVLAIADEQPEEASSSPSIVHENSLTAGLSAPVPLVQPARMLSAEFYMNPLFKNCLEYLNFKELTKARAVSPLFRDMAPHALMPTGPRWIAWVTEKFDKAKTAQQQNEAILELIAAIVRSPNPVVRLRGIVNNYYNDVPKGLRFWNMNRGKPVPNKKIDDLRTELETTANRIAAVKAASQSAETAQELDTLNAKQQQLVEQLLPSLHALAPYAAANNMLLELGDVPSLPENLSVIPKHQTALNDRLIQILLKKFSPSSVMTTRTVELLPLVHAMLATQSGQIHRATRPLLELRLIQPYAYRPFDPTLSNEIMQLSDYQDVACAILKIRLLERAISGFILHDKKISKRELEVAMRGMKESLLEFLLGRITNYIKKANSIDHVFWLMNKALTTAHAPELEICRAVTRCAYENGWATFFRANDQHKATARVAHNLALHADRSVCLAGSSLTAYDLRAAAQVKIGLATPALIKNAKDATQLSRSLAAEYYDRLITEFGDAAATVSDYLIASQTHTLLACKSNNDEKAKRHLNVAMEYMMYAPQALPPITTYAVLKKYLGEAEKVVAYCSEQVKIFPQCEELAARGAEIISLIREKMRIIVAADAPQ